MGLNNGAVFKKNKKPQDIEKFKKSTPISCL